MEDAGGLPIQGAGIMLRPFRLDDVAAVTAACQDDEIIRWTASIPSPYEETHARTWIEHHETWRSEGTRFPFAIVDPSDRLLGCISLIREGAPRDSGAIGYWMAAWGRKQGVATRALVMLCVWAFNALPVQCLELVTLLGNTASERVAEKAGFRMVEEMSEFVHPAAAGETFRAKRWIKTRPAA